jgi:hypothetical protein
MKEAKNKSIVYLVVLSLLLSICLILFWKCIYQDIIPYIGTAVVVAFLFLYEVFTILFVEKKTKTANPRQIVSLYMLLKGVKLLVFLAVLVFYMLAVKIETKRFVLVAVAIYFIYLLWDTWFLTSTEKKLKKK